MTTAEQQDPTAVARAAAQGVAPDSAAPDSAAPDVAAPDVAIVIPVKNEAGNIGALVDEIARELTGHRFEVVCVDDGSDDGTGAELAEVKRRSGWLTVVRHRESCGQSTATLTGVRAARADWIVTIDGDGQNPPGEIRKLIAARDAATGAVAMVAGQRERRNDSWFRRLSSRVANGVRQGLLKDGIRDTGCSLKLFRRQTFLDLPYFDHMHRFLPALVQRQGGTVITTPVAHRARVHGVSKYGFHNRLWPGLVDLAGVLWLQRRARIPHIEKTD